MVGVGAGVRVISHMASDAGPPQRTDQSKTCEGVLVFLVGRAVRVVGFGRSDHGPVASTLCGPVRTLMGLSCDGGPAPIDGPPGVD